MVITSESGKKSAKRSPQHRNARSTAAKPEQGISELPKAWRLLNAACLDHETSTVSAAILKIPAVGRWIMQAKATERDESEAACFVNRAANRIDVAKPEEAGRIGETMPSYAVELARDKRATALVTMAVAFQRTARLPLKTPGAHCKHYQQMAQSLRKLAEKMREDIMPAIQRHAAQLESVAAEAATICTFAKDPEWVKQWLHERPQRAASIDFADALKSRLKEDGCKAHDAIAAAVTNELFQGARMTAQQIQRRTR